MSSASQTVLRWTFSNVGLLLIALGALEAGLFLTNNKPISKYAPHPVIGPVLFATAVAFIVHLALEVRSSK